MSNTRFNEQGALVESATTAPGVHRVRIITEGEGSSGVYPASVLKEYASAFEKAPSYMNHPMDLTKPHLRDVTTIAGKIVSKVEYAEVDGVAGLYADLKVDKRWQEFVEEYKDVIGLSIYIEGDSSEDSMGKRVAESFNGADPYKSVDFVVAAGRGGRIEVERAMESLRHIESSIGHPPLESNPSAEASVRDNKKEIMDKETLDAIDLAVKNALAPVTAFIAESKNAQQQELQGTADAEAVKVAVEAALAEYKEKDALITAAEILPVQAESLRAIAMRGEDISAPLAEAVKIVAEAKTTFKVDGSFSETLRIGESAADEDWSVSSVRFNTVGVSA